MTFLMIYVIYSLIIIRLILKYIETKIIPFLLMISFLGVHAQQSQTENNEAIARSFVESWIMEN